MANIVINYPSTVFVPVCPCQTVYLCLEAGWENQTVSGTRFILATIGAAGRSLDKHTTVMYDPGPRCDEKYQYQLIIDDTQFSNPEEVDLECSDICEIFPYVCTLSNLLTLIAA